MSAALQAFLTADVADVSDGDEPGDVSDLTLGDLDITTADIGLKGVEEQIEHFAEHEVLRAILDQGCDPKEYGRQYEAKLRQAELESIQDYITESDNLVILHSQISSCDQILATMEEMLGKFQGDLGNISTEIRSLQEQSQSMSVKLKNRKGTEQKLGSFIENVAIPPALVEGIMASEVDEGFHEHLLALHKKLEFLESNETAQSSASFRDVAPELERLRVRAIGKARDYLMTRIYALRKPKTNIQILQQNVLLKYKYLVTFLRMHGKEVFLELRAAYVDTLSRVLSSHFRAYLTAIERLQEDVASASDVIGSAAASSTGVMAMFARATQAHEKADVFALGERAAILHHLDQAALIPHVLEAQNKKFPFEVLFRSVHKLLMDTATSEYLFCCEFFQEDAVFHELFAATLTVVESSLAATLQDMYDMVGLLLMIRINYHHQLIMNKRRIPCLDGALDRINLMLWPRFKSLFDLQLASIKNYNPGSFSEDVKLHFITQRYAQLTASLLQLNADYQDGQLDHNIDRMRYAAMDLLLKLSRTFSKKKLGTIFLIINFTHVVTVLREASSRQQAAPAPQAAAGAAAPASQPNATGNETIKEFDDQLVTCTAMYVEDQLGGHFGDLITFVKKAEAAAKQKGGALEGRPIPGYGPAEAAPIVKDFAAKWTAAVEALHKDTMKDFKNGVWGREVIKAAMTQLLLYYTRLLELLKKAGPEGAALLRDAVTVPSIMYEIKRYNRA
ncbi:hypothetical protein WJX72_001832 [[Myrmecia] bisecta]|uniref:Vacuolar protein sorting-associated protein 52 A n=1 Tax=[Myrmecia] bisecta TaxID=41462 RepID=A0AAW1QEA4_9CHLO